MHVPYIQQIDLPLNSLADIQWSTSGQSSNTAIQYNVTCSMCTTAHSKLNNTAKPCHTWEAAI
jgi:hypothetical protein